MAEPESEPPGNGVARQVAHAAADFDTPHAHLRKGPVAERPHGRRHDSFSLLLFTQPVADLDAVLFGVGRFEADQSGKGPAVADRVDRVGRVGEHSGHHRFALFDAVGLGDEREPAAEVPALGVDRAENIRGILRTELPECVGAEKGNRIHSGSGFQSLKIVKRTEGSKPHCRRSARPYGLPKAPSRHER